MNITTQETKPSPPKIRYSFLKILSGSDLSRRRLPYMIAESRNPGPIVWLTACGHGDEVGGIVVIQEIFKIIRKHLLKGAIYAFPLMNPLGFETSSRNITLTKEDLNRSFPGSKSGSVAERIADKIFTTIKETNPTVVLDLHNDWVKSIPYTLLDLIPEDHFSDVHEKIKVFSKQAGFIIISDTEELRKSLSYCLIQHNIPALTLELGESYVVNEINITYGVKSILNILRHLEMIESRESFFTYPLPLPEIYKDKILKYTDRPLCSSSGIIRFLSKPGDIVKKNQPIAKIFNAFGKIQETSTALDDGIVLGHSDSSVAFPGSPVMTFGII